MPTARLALVESLADEIKAAGGRAEAVAFDVTDRAAVHLACTRLLEGGPVQVLVNNAERTTTLRSRRCKKRSGRA